MNIWLDDQRTSPEGWTHVHNLDELKTLLEVASQNSEFYIDTMSFDFHLSHPRKGVDVMRYLADLCVNNQTRRFWPRTTLYHSNDPEGVEIMKAFATEFEGGERFRKLT
jgi:hypothetical protein